MLSLNSNSRPSSPSAPDRASSNPVSSSAQPSPRGPEPGAPDLPPPRRSGGQEAGCVSLPPRNPRPMGAGMPPPPHEPAAAHRSPTVAAEVEQWRQGAANSLPEHSRDLLRSLDLQNYVHDETPPTLKEFVSMAAQAVLGALNGRSLAIRNLPTTTLPSAIGRLTHLQELSIDTTQCRELPESLCDLAKLHTLELSTNRELTRLPDRIWELRELKSLKVKETPLTSLPDGIGALSKLEKLELGGGIYELPPDLTKLTALTSLKIDRHPNLQALPADLAKLKKLTQLEVLNCKELTSLPEGLGQLASLRMLSLQGCEKLKVLPSDLANLSRLRHLDLSGCTGLQGFPESLARLSKSCEEFFMPPRLQERMEAIRLTRTSLPVRQPEAPADHSSPTVAQEVAQWCLQAAKAPVPEIRYDNTTPPTPGSPGRLVLRAAEAIIKAAEHGGTGLAIQVLPATSLPPAIGRLTPLQILWIERTACTALPDSICDLAQLRSLSVLQTPLESLPENIGKLSSLAKLQLSGSDWEQLPLGLTALTALSKLFVSEHRKLKEVPAELGHLAKLQELKITKCPELRSLPPLGRLSALENLDLSNCTNLETLPSDLGDLRNLHMLTLTGCSTLKQLPESLSRLSPSCTIRAPGHLQKQLAEIRSRRDGSPAAAAEGEKRA